MSDHEDAPPGESGISLRARNAEEEARVESGGTNEALPEWTLMDVAKFGTSAEFVQAARNTPKELAMVDDHGAHRSSSHARSFSIDPESFSTSSSRVGGGRSASVDMDERNLTPVNHALAMKS